MKRRIFLILLIFVIILSCFELRNTSNVYAATTSDGNFEYSITNGKATITRYNKKFKQTSVTVPSSVGGVPVTALGKSVFEDDTIITSIVLPDTITEIGESAISDCRSLQTINIPKNLKTIGYFGFYRNKSLKSLELPEGLTLIDEYAFRECTSLSSIKLPSTLTEIRKFAFEDCSSLKQVVLPSNLQTLGYGVFANCTSLAKIEISSANNYFKTSSEGVLYDNSLKTLITYPGGATAQTFDMPNSVTKIENCAFEGNKYIKKINIASSVKEIGFRAFKECSNLTDAKLPDDLENLGSQVFCGCASLKTMDIPPKITTLPAGLFESSGIENYKIPSTVTKLQHSIFMKCTNLKSVTIPSSVTQMNHSIFSLCSNLESVVVPDSIKTIEHDTFYECNKVVVTTTKDSAMHKYALQNNIKVNIVATLPSDNNSEDKTPPTIISVTGNPIDFTDKDVTLTVNAEDKESGIAKTNGYSFDGGKTWQTSNTKTYTENTSGIVIKVKDAKGNIATFSPAIDITKIKKSTSQKEPIEVKGYTLKDKTIKNVTPKTSVENFKKNIVMNNEQNTKILGKDGKELATTAQISTGSKIQVKVDNNTIEYKIIVTGDVDGNGEANLDDILKMNKHRLSKAKLENEYLSAGDINADNVLDFKDILQLNKYRLGKIKTL